LNAAAYLRVSTRAQGVGLQREAIKRASSARGDNVRVWFEEKKSGATLQRAELERVRAKARAGELRRLYVYRLDRLSRGGIRQTLAIVEELRVNGCELVSVADGFDLNGPAGDVVIAVMAWAAQMERQALSERISAARVRVEAQGGHWGRPRRVGAVTERKIRQLAKDGYTQRELAAEVKVPRSTVRAVLGEKGPYGRGQKIPVAKR